MPDLSFSRVICVTCYVAMSCFYGCFGELLSPLQKWKHDYCDFQSLWCDMVYRLDAATLNRVVVVCHGIWKRMNE